MKKLVKIGIIILVILTSIALLFIGKGYQMYKEAIEEMPLSEKIETIQKKENYISIDELPQIYQNAVISVEDHRFYKHGGIDIIAIGRALINDIKAMSFVEGGSTIPQQLAKNLYFTQEKLIERKVAEVFMAFEIEKNYDKKEILEFYLNTSYFGNGYDTAKEASLGYFGKLPKELNESQCIMLAGIPNAPSVYNPKVNLTLAIQRQKQVANKLVEYGYFTEQEMDEILKQKIF